MMKLSRNYITVAERKPPSFLLENKPNRLHIKEAVLRNNSDSKG
jgi:hypothetical protein